MASDLELTQNVYFIYVYLTNMKLFVSDLLSCTLKYNSIGSIVSFTWHRQKYQMLSASFFHLLCGPGYSETKG